MSIEEAFDVPAVEGGPALEAPRAEGPPSVEDGADRRDQPPGLLDEPSGAHAEPAAGTTGGTLAGAQADAPLLSVVVPTYERRDALLCALEALGRQTLAPEEFEVVVVVDGSQDGTQEALALLRTPYALRSLLQENRGRAQAINAGLAVARGGLVVLVDDDLLPEPGFLAAHAAAHDGKVRRGAVGPVRFHLEPGTPPFAAYWGRRFSDFLSRLEAKGGEMSWTGTYTGAFSIRREDLAEIGGFEKSFDGYGLEDFELALRLDRAGVELMLCPEAVAYHEYDKDFSAGARDAESRGRSAVVFSRRHPEIDAMQFAPEDLVPPSIPRRFIRYVLPRMTTAFPFTRGLVTASVGEFERRRSKHLDFAYTLALEYFFLVGVREASRDGRPTARVER